MTTEIEIRKYLHTAHRIGTIFVEIQKKKNGKNNNVHMRLRSDVLAVPNALNFIKLYRTETHARIPFEAITDRQNRQNIKSK